MRQRATRMGAISSGRGTGFSPLSLFAVPGTDGTWQSRRDLLSMWVDNLGVTQLSAPGQTIGFAADKSKGMMLGPELVVNGDFSSATGWTLPSDVSITSGKLVFGPSSISTATASNVGAVVAGRVYLVSFAVSNYVQGSCSAVLAGMSGTPIAVVGPYSEKLPASASGLIAFRARGGTGFTGSVDDFSVREFLGNHATQVTPTARPLYQVGPQRGVMDAVDDVLNTPFPTSLGAACTVARAIPGVGAQILTAQTIGTSFADTVTSTEFIIVNRALTAGETASLTAWLNAAVL